MLAQRRQLRKNLRRNRALTNDGLAGVERLHQRRARLRRTFLRRLRRLIEGGTSEHQLNIAVTVHANTIKLLLRCLLRHINSALDLQFLTRIGHALCMIACRRRDNPRLTLLRRQLRNIVVGTANLIGTHILQILTLQIHLRARLLGQARAILQRSRGDHAGNAGLGQLDISSVNGEHGGCGGPAGFAWGGGTGGGCWFGGGSGVGAIGANGHGEDSSPDAGGNRTRVREGGNPN